MASGLHPVCWMKRGDSIPACKADRLQPALPSCIALLQAWRRRPGPWAACPRRPGAWAARLRHRPACSSRARLRRGLPAARRRRQVAGPKGHRARASRRAGRRRRHLAWEAPLAVPGRHRRPPAWGWAAWACRRPRPAGLGAARRRRPARGDRRLAACRLRLLLACSCGPAWVDPRPAWAGPRHPREWADRLPRLPSSSSRAACRRRRPSSSSRQMRHRRRRRRRRKERFVPHTKQHLCTIPTFPCSSTRQRERPYTALSFN